MASSVKNRKENGAYTQNRQGNKSLTVLPQWSNFLLPQVHPFQSKRRGQHPGQQRSRTDSGQYQKRRNTRVLTWIVILPAEVSTGSKSVFRFSVYCEQNIVFRYNVPLQTFMYGTESYQDVERYTRPDQVRKRNGGQFAVYLEQTRDGLPGNRQGKIFCSLSKLTRISRRSTSSSFGMEIISSFSLVCHDENQISSLFWLAPGTHY